MAEMPNMSLGEYHTTVNQIIKDKLISTYTYNSTCTIVKLDCLIARLKRAQIEIIVKRLCSARFGKQHIPTVFLCAAEKEKNIGANLNTLAHRNTSSLNN